MSGATGRFLFPFLPPGVYTLRAELPGFAPLELREIHLTPNQTLDLPLVLEGGGPSDVLIVSAEPNAIDTTSSSIRYWLAGRKSRNFRSSRKAAIETLWTP